MRQFLFQIAKVVISVALLYLALRGVNFDAIQSRLVQIDPLWIAVAIAVALAQIVVAAARWRYIATACGHTMPAGTANRFGFIAAFFNQTLPSSIGGDGVRLWLLRRHGASWQTAAYSVLVDRAVGVIVLAVIVVASLPWSYRLIVNDHARLALVLLDAVTLASALGFLLLGRLSYSWLRSWWPVRHIHACSEIANAVMFRFGGRLNVLGLSLLNHLMTVIVAWCAARAIGSAASLSDLALLIPPVILIMMVPISIAGWGLREQSMQAAFTFAGLSGADGVVISILFGGVYFVTGAAGGFAWFFSPEKAKAGTAALLVADETVTNPDKH